MLLWATVCLCQRFSNGRGVPEHRKQTNDEFPCQSSPRANVAKAATCIFQHVSSDFYPVAFTPVQFPRKGRTCWKVKLLGTYADTVSHAV